MTAQEVELVQQSWRKIQTSAAAEMFYNKLFELDTNLRALFKQDMKEQGRALIKMIGVAVASLTRLEAVLPAVQDLGRRHAHYGVRDGDYGTFAEALLWTLEQGLGADFTPEVKQAWTHAYTLLATTMQRAARDSGYVRPLASDPMLGRRPVLRNR